MRRIMFAATPLICLIGGLCFTQTARAQATQGNGSAVITTPVGDNYSQTPIPDGSSSQAIITHVHVEITGGDSGGTGYVYYEYSTKITSLSHPDTTPPATFVQKHPSEGIPFVETITYDGGGNWVLDDDYGLNTTIPNGRVEAKSNLAFNLSGFQNYPSDPVDFWVGPRNSGGTLGP